jgi:hypothetical protein
MIYDPFPDEIPSVWIRMGTLSLAGPNVTAAASQVGFYATSRAAADALRAPLTRFSASLPPGVTFASTERQPVAAKSPTFHVGGTTAR